MLSWRVPGIVWSIFVIAGGAAIAQPCKPVADGAITVHKLPSRKSDTIPSSDQSPFIRLGPAMLAEASEWFQIRAGAATGWVNAAEVACQFPADQVKGIIAARAKQAVLALRRPDYAQLAGLVHPLKGLRLSPYGSLDDKTDTVLPARSIASLRLDRRKRLWGNFDGSGDPIRLTFAEYHKQFLFDRNFAAVPDVAYGEAARKESQTLATLRETFPNAILVDYHSRGVDPKREGADWASLWLVFERVGNIWYLVAAVHDTQTV